MVQNSLVYVLSFILTKRPSIRFLAKAEDWAKSHLRGNVAALNVCISYVFLNKPKIYEL